MSNDSIQNELTLEEAMTDLHNEINYNLFLGTSVIDIDNLLEEPKRVSIQGVFDNYTVLDAGKLLDVVSKNQEYILNDQYQLKTIISDLILPNKIKSSKKIRSVNRLIKEVKKLNFDISLDDTVDELFEKNKHSPFFDQNVSVDKLKEDLGELQSAFKEYAEEKEVVDFLDEKLVEVNKSMQYVHEAKRLNELFFKVTSVIGQLQKEDIQLPIGEVDNLLIDVLYEDVSLHSALKQIRAKKEIRPTYRSRSKIIKAAAKIPVVKDFSETEYSQRELKFLTSRGFSSVDAKYILHKKQFDVVKSNIDNIESIFENAGIDGKEALPIYKHATNIVKLHNGYAKQYLEQLSILFETYDPKIVSGILPKYHLDKYQSVAGLKQLIPSLSPDVIVTGLDLIKTEKLREKENARLTAEPFTGEIVQKYENGKNAGYSFMYRKCADLAGEEGHFRKIKVGKQRILTQVKNIGDNKREVSILFHEETHPAYEKKLGFGK